MSKLAIAYAMKKRMKDKKANKGVHESSMEERTGQWAGESKAGERVRHESMDEAKDEHNRVLGELKSMKKPDLQGLAKGGMAGAEMEDEKMLGQRPVDMQSSTSMMVEDMVDRIMRKKYSHGGQVANEDEITADFLPNEFDDLALRDDLESSYGDDDNSGDALGNAQESEDRKDIVSRIMASRRKKDRMPRPA